MSGRRARLARVIALADQAEAAALQAEATVLALAARDPTLVARRGGEWPLLTDAARRISASVSDGEATLCPHIGAHAMPLQASVQDPTTLRCLTCAERHNRKVQGTVADHTCDDCRAVDPAGVHAGVMAAGPVLITFGLCGTCHETNRRRWSA
jgi:hypothetical protein